MAKTTRKKKVSFVATKYKAKKVNVNFYTKEGKKVAFDSVKKVSNREKVVFYTKPKKVENGK